MTKIRDFFLRNTSLHQTLAKNTFWLFLGEIISRLLKMILIIYAARTLGTDGWGLFAYALSIASLIYVFSDFGLENIVTREISKNSDKKMEFFSTAFIIRSVLLLLSLVTIIIIAQYISGVENILIILALVLTFDSLRNLILSINRAMEMMEKDTFIKTVSSFIVASLGISVLLYEPSIINLAYAYLIGSLAGLILSIYSLREYIINISKNFSKDLIKPIFNTAWPFLFFWITATIMVYTDIIILGWLKTPADLGLYSAPQRLIQFLLIIPNLIAVATLPLFSKLFLEDKNKLRNTLEETLSTVLLFALPISICGIILGEQIIMTVFGAEYLGSVLVFQIFLGMLIVTFPITIINNFIFIQNIQNRFVLYAVVGAIVNIILNFILIPEFGIYGAVSATALSTLLLAIPTWYITKRFSYFKISSRLGKILTATIITSLVTFLLRNYGINIFLNISLSIVLFVSILLFLKEELLIESKKIFIRQEQNQ